MSGSDPWAVVSSKPAQSNPWAVVAHAPTDAPSRPEGASPPDLSYRSIQNPDTAFPRDEAGYAYGSVLPYRKNLQTGSLDWSPGFSEAIRMPARGLADFWERITGPLTPEKMRGLSPDEQAAFLTFGGLSQAARTPSAPPPETPIGGLTRADAATVARQAGRTAQADRQAAGLLNKKLTTDIGASGQTPADLADRLARGRALGKPLTIADVAGPNVRGLAGTVARHPEGDASTIMRQFYEPRDKATGARLHTDVARDLAQGPSARRTVEGLWQAQSTVGGPLYEKAFEGGSIAPLAQQFAAAARKATLDVEAASKVVEDAQKRSAGAITDINSADPHTADNAPAAFRAAQQDVTAAKQRLAAAVADQRLTQEVSDAAAHDIVTNAPGAVWSPTIERLMRNPDVRRGIGPGLRIIRNEADAAGKRFDPTEYAVQTDASGNILIGEDGNPVVNKVPNMRLLDAAKRGMDGIIAANRDEHGRLNQLGRSVDQLRRGLLSETDRLNPIYNQARASWTSHAASIDAVNLGRKFASQTPEELADAVAGMAPSDREFLRIGVADSVVQRIESTAFSGDESKAVINSLWREGQLRAVFPTEAAAQDFIDSVALERLMFDTRQMIYGNSQTVARATQDAANKTEMGMHVAHGALHALSGSYMATLRSAVRLAKYLGLKPSNDLNAAVARILTDPDYVPTVTPRATQVMPTAPPLPSGPTSPFPPSPIARSMQP
jgi:hypothetical protein